MSTRRVLIKAGLSVAAMAASAVLPACAAEALEMEVHRDPNCGCCHLWTVQIGRSGRFQMRMIDDADMGAFKRRVGVPDDLASCHTTTLERFVIEGHVPEADIERLLSVRPRDVRGLAVPGMPVGSPGMEMPDGRRDAFEVIAFSADGARRVFAQYAAST